MSNPHLCPKCNGMKVIPNPGLAADDVGVVTLQMIQCPTCEGVGVLWEPKRARTKYVVVSPPPQEPVIIWDGATAGVAKPAPFTVTCNATGSAGLRVGDGVEPLTVGNIPGDCGWDPS